jgi:hypothetical protein
LSKSSSSPSFLFLLAILSKASIKTTPGKFLRRELMLALYLSVIVQLYFKTKAICATMSGDSIISAPMFQGRFSSLKWKTTQLESLF